jgi:SAM-dependent methyltransferase
MNKIQCDGYSVIAEKNGYTIKDSYTLSVSEAARRIIGGYCPLFSENRQLGLLRFTVVPFAKFDGFDLVKCSERELTKEALLDSIKSVLPTPSTGPVVLYGMELSRTQILDFKKESIMSCSWPSSLLIDFIDEGHSPGSALDLGCGIGSNTGPLLKKGWSVVGVDISPLAIASCDKTYAAAKDHLTLIESDATSISLSPSSFDLVVAVDVLPYINPTDLPPLIEKIHDCLVPNGRFIGTLFFTPPTGVSQAEVTLKALGSHFYEGDYITQALLKNFGFEVNKCAIRYNDAPDCPGCAQFIATKLSS